MLDWLQNHSKCDISDTTLALRNMGRAVEVQRRPCMQESFAGHFEFTAYDEHMIHSSTIFVLEQNAPATAYVTHMR